MSVPTLYGFPSPPEGGGGGGGGGDAYGYDYHYYYDYDEDVAADYQGDRHNATMAVKQGAHPHHPRMPSLPEGVVITEQQLAAIYKFLLDMNFSSSSAGSAIDLGSPVLRPSFRSAFPLGLTVFMYGAICALGILGNLVVVSAVSRRSFRNRRYQEQQENTLTCVLNLCAAFLLQLSLVVPFSVFVLVVQNWVLGSFVCYMLPMIQDVPHFCLMLTLLMVSADRHSTIVRNASPLIPMRWAVALAWAVSVGLVLPYSAYIKYIDLSVLGESLHGGEMCLVNLISGASNYIKALFVTMYLLPMAVSVFLLSRTSHELRRRESLMRKTMCADGNSSGAAAETTNMRRSRNYSYDSDSGEGPMGGMGDLADKSFNAFGELPAPPPPPPPQEKTASAAMDVRKEMRAQKFLLIIAFVYFLCLLPLNILKIVRQMVDETYENDDHFDITYVVIVFVAILPSVIVPAIVCHWILIGSVSLRHIGKLFSNSDTSETAFDQGPAVGGHRQQQPPVSAVNSMHMGGYSESNLQPEQPHSHQPYRQQQHYPAAALPPQRRSKRSRAEETANFHAVQRYVGRDPCNTSGAPAPYFPNDSGNECNGCDADRGANGRNGNVKGARGGRRKRERQSLAVTCGNRLCEENAARILAARKKVQADPSVARRKSLDYLADDDGDDDIRRDMVARRLSYQQHKSEFDLDTDDTYYENTRENRSRSPGYAIVV